MRWEKKLAISDRIAFMAVMISVFSLVVSVRSCNNSERAIGIEKEKYDDARRFIYIASPISDLQFKLEPSNKNMVVTWVDVTIPEVFAGKANKSSILSLVNGMSPKTETKKDVVLDLGFIQSNLNKIFSPRITTGINGVMSTAESLTPAIDTVLETQYIAENQVRKDRSLYKINCWGQIALPDTKDGKSDKRMGAGWAQITFRPDTKDKDREHLWFHVSFGKLLFIRRLDDKEDAVSVVEAAWKETEEALSKIHGGRAN